MEPIEKIAHDIWDAVGGKDNVLSLVYCATRLRFELTDDSIVDEHKLSTIESITGHFRTNGQYQIILGMGTVKSVYDELAPMLELEMSGHDSELNAVQKAIKALSDLVGKD